MPRRCFKGFRKEVWPVPGGGNLTFRGIKNFDATIEWALKHGLDKATEFALTGGSAGRNKQPPLATENLLEDTDGLRRPPSSKGGDAIHQCPLGAAALYFC